MREAEFGDTMPEYDALSYTWGSEPRDCRISCNQKTLVITPNCRSALRRLRLNSKSRLVWVDSICINQTSILERNHQVRLMGEIYKRATRVIAWLGRGNESSRMAYRFLKKSSTHLKEMFKLRSIESMKRHVETYGARAVEDIWEWLGSALDPLGTENQQDGRKWTLSKASLRINAKEAVIDDRKIAVDCIEQLTQRLWFERIWTVQELALAQQCVLVCGEDRILWEEFVDVLRVLAWIPNHRFIQLPLLGHLFAKQMVESQQPLDAPQDHRSTLQLFHTCRSKNSTDPRDKVFGLFGLLQACKIKTYDADYDKPAERIYIDAARMILESSRSPLLLLFAAPSPDFTIISPHYNLPSWVPDWSFRGFDAYLKDHPFDGYLVPPWAWKLLSIETPRFGASRKSRMVSYDISTDGRSLTLFGHNSLDEVTSVENISNEDHLVHPPLTLKDFPNTPQETLSLLNWRWDLLIPILRRCINSTDVESSASQEGLHALPSMIKHLTTKSTARYGNDRGWYKYCFEQWTSHLSAAVCADLQAIYCMDIDDDAPFVLGLFSTILANVPPIQDEAIPFSIKFSLDKYSLDGLYREPKWSSVLSTLLAQNLETGLAILDDPHAEPFHQEVMKVLADHYIYFTKGGRMGLSCSPVKSGDVIALVEALHVPILLRPQEETTGSSPRYKLVGSTYLSGAMEGELWVNANFEEIILV